MKKQRIFIVDDSEVARTMLKNILNQDDLVEVVGEEKTGMGAVFMFEELNPDVVLLETGISGDMPLTKIISEIRRLDENVKIVLCADVLSQGKTMEASSLGADDFIGKPYRSQTILRILKEFREASPD